MVANEGQWTHRVIFDCFDARCFCDRSCFRFKRILYFTVKLLASRISLEIVTKLIDG